MDTFYNAISIIGGLVLLGCFAWVALNAAKPTNSEYLKQVDEIVEESRQIHIQKKIDELMKEIVEK